MKTITVRLDTIRYGGWENLKVAIDIDSPKNLYMTYPTAEILLKYETDSLKEKIVSKSLEYFLGESRTIMVQVGNILNKENMVCAKVNLISLDDFLAVAQWETVENQNKDVGHLLAMDFENTFNHL